MTISGAKALMENVSHDTITQKAKREYDIANGVINDLIAKFGDAISSDELVCVPASKLAHLTSLVRDAAQFKMSLVAMSKLDKVSIDNEEIMLDPILVDAFKFGICVAIDLTEKPYIKTPMNNK